MKKIIFLIAIISSLSAKAIVSIDFDMLSPTFKMIRASNNQRLSFLLEIEVTKQWTLGYDYFIDEGNYYSSVQGGTSDKSAPAIAHGLRWNFYFSDFKSSPWFMGVGTGAMERTFKNTTYQDVYTKGSYALFEVGKRLNILNWMYLSGNIAYLASNIAPEQSFGAETLRADTHYTLLKFSIGFVY